LAGDQNQPLQPLFPLLLLALHRRPGLADDLANLGNMLTGISASVKGIQTGLEVFHQTIRNAAYGMRNAPAEPPPEEPGDGLKESVKNLDALFARLKNNPGGP